MLNANSLSHWSKTVMYSLRIPTCNVESRKDISDFFIFITTTKQTSEGGQKVGYIETCGQMAYLSGQLHTNTNNACNSNFYGILGSKY